MSESRIQPEFQLHIRVCVRIHSALQMVLVHYFGCIEKVL